MKKLNQISAFCALLLMSVLATSSISSCQNVTETEGENPEMQMNIECESNYHLESAVSQLNKVQYIYRNQTCVYAGGIGSIIEVESNINEEPDDHPLGLAINNTQNPATSEAPKDFNSNSCAELYTDEEILSWQDWIPVCALNFEEMEVEYCDGKILLSENDADAPFCSHALTTCILKFELDPESQKVMLFTRESCGAEDWSCCLTEYQP